MTEWINCNDRLPPQDVYVLVNIWDGREKVKMNHRQIAMRIGDIWFDDKDEAMICKKYGVVTHWMPLPEDPIN